MIPKWSALKRSSCDAFNVVISVPRILMHPRFGLISPVKQFNNVVFPHPLGPSINMCEWESMLKLFIDKEKLLFGLYLKNKSSTLILLMWFDFTS